MIRRARELMNETMAFMMNELLETKDDINKTSSELDNYKKLAIEDGETVESARKNAINASELATKTENDLNSSLEKVEQLIVEIEAMEDIDYKTLEDAENRFAVAKEIIEGTIASEIEFLQNMLVEQNNTITQHVLDLEPLRKQIKHVNTLYTELPRKCFMGDAVEEEV